ncbi:MAG TPA: phosphatidate cytidylyltransferase [Acidimicrobiales bacterium]|jgi:phosphatidate cytidylyltransferase|nr:phosphatidate cytidylyltransferase [Acidimicrobiales bacterium]
MDEELFPHDKQPEETTEGVRIIGADEAEKAIEREDVARRLPEDAPRYGDRPEGPPDDGPRPAIRFPLTGSSDPTDIERPPVLPPDPVRTSGEHNLPHWTEPATGEVPKVLASSGEGDDDLDAWSSFTTSQPRWRGEGPQSDRDEFNDFSRLADEETRVGALDPNPPGPEEFFEFDELGPDPADPQQATRPISSDPRQAGVGRSAGKSGFDRPADSGRDLQQAVLIGVALGAAFVLCALAGPKYVMVLVVAIIAAAAVELFTVMRRAGYHPATLLGIAAAVTLPMAAYWKGESAYPVVLFLTAVFGLLWYLVGAGGDDSPVLGLSSTLFVVCYVAVLGSFAALILTLPDGIGVLWGALLTTVAYDVGAFFVGRSLGTRPMSSASPNKTFEGLAGGWIVCVLAAVVIVGFIAPWSNDSVSLGDKLLFGLVAALAATLGDLCESVIKRDLGVKDMGTLLPGHGGILDRFDAMLFVLPATYYAALILVF